MALPSSMLQFSGHKDQKCQTVCLVCNSLIEEPCSNQCHYIMSCDCLYSFELPGREKIFRCIFVNTKCPVYLSVPVITVIMIIYIHVCQSVKFSL